MYPTRTSQLSCIVLSQTDGPFELAANMIQMLPIFRGVESENPYYHVREFEQICRTMQFENISEDSLKLRLFTFSLKESAKSWFYSLRPQSITTWDQLTTIFFKKLFPYHRTINIRQSIKFFFQLDGETLFHYFESFNDLLLECPHHGFEKWRLVAILYEGLNFKSQALVESMCNGEFIDKIVDDAWSFLAEVVEKTHQWESYRETRTMSHDMGDLHESDVDFDSNANIEFLIRRVEALERCTNENSDAPKLCIQTEFSFSISCDSLGHLIENCSELHAIKQSKLHCANTSHQMNDNNPYSLTCELGRRNNLNISCIDDPTQGLQPAVSQVVTVPNENERSDEHVDYKFEMFVFTNELNSEYSVSYPIAENVNPYSPILEADVWAENTNGFDKVGFSCICDDDDDDDIMLEEVINSENEISECCKSEMLNHNVEIFIDNIPSNVDIHRNDVELGLVQ
ncbi:uncharacterized protein LOC113318306 [Papaver somniferum]|uniref:uncharacterized protein LOC113318306 n=1 Tax=Papaver somniferum TaxID=3469 RepID=UPI000E705A5E|nr:uncharacterized protein LOC113318306 [Papaver somniferum]